MATDGERYCEQSANGNRKQHANLTTPGIRSFQHHGKPAVQWRFEGKTKTRTFTSERDRDQFARELDRRRADFGREVLQFDVREWRDFQRLKQATGGATCAELEAAWIRAGAIASQPTAGVIASYLSDLKAAAGEDTPTIKHARANLNRLKDAMGGKPLSELTPDTLQSWIAAEPVGLVTKAGIMRRVGSMFRWAIPRGYAATNPAQLVKIKQPPAKDVPVLSPEQAARLLAVNRGKPYIGRLALEVFAGMRFASAAKATLADINATDKGITLPADKIKTRKRHYIQNLPENLWPWLALPCNDWSLSEAAYLKAKSVAFELAEVPHPHNVLRHTAASYHVAANGDVGKTATMLCNSPQMIYRHYLGRATSEAARRFYSILP